MKKWRNACSTLHPDITLTPLKATPASVVMNNVKTHTEVNKALLQGTPATVNATLEKAHKRAGVLYCHICGVSTGNEHNHSAHVLGRKHQQQLKRIEYIGFTSWSKREEKKTTRQLRKAVSKATILQKLGQLISRPNHVQTDLTPEGDEPGKSDDGETGSNTKERTDAMNTEAHDKESVSTSFVKSSETSHSKISNDGSNCPSLGNVPTVPEKDSQIKDFQVSSSSYSTKMHPHNNVNHPPYDGRSALSWFDPSVPPPNLYMGAGHQYWQHYPPPSYDGRARFQQYQGHSPRTSLYFPGAHGPSFSQKYNQPVNSEGLFPRYSKDYRLDAQNNQPRASSSGSWEKHSVEKQRKDDMHSQSHRSRRQSDSHRKSNDSHDKPSKSVRSTEAGASKRASPSEKSQVQNTVEYTRENQSKRKRNEKQRSSSKNEELSLKSGPEIPNEKPQVQNTVEYTRENQSKRKRNEKQRSSSKDEELLLKSGPELKSVKCTQSRPLSSESDSSVSAKSPTFSNVVMQRANARLQSFAKYGKMPTSGQIRHLALSCSSSVREKGDGKLQEWSKKIEQSHHNLRAEDKELINRLVNYPCSRREQKKLQYCIQEHARSRKKLTLPRFNLQLSGTEMCKDSQSMDDGVNSMATEVVDCLPEELLNSLINALNSDIDENITVDFPLCVDSDLRVQSEDEDNGSSHSKCEKKGLEEDIFLTVDEVGECNTSGETVEYPEHENPDDSHPTSSRHDEMSKNLSPKDQVTECSYKVNDHSCLVEATEQQSLGSSLEIRESQKISGTSSVVADQHKSAVEVRIKKEPSSPRNRNTETNAGCIEIVSSNGNANLAATQKSGNLPKRTHSESASVLAGNEKSNIPSVGTVQVSPSKASPSSHSRNSFLPHLNSSVEPLNTSIKVKQEPKEEENPSACDVSTMEQIGKDNPNVRTMMLGLSLRQSSLKVSKDKHVSNSNVEAQDGHVLDHRNEATDITKSYPGLSWITKPHQEQLARIQEATQTANLSHSIANQGFAEGAVLTASESIAIKVEPGVNNKDGLTSLPKISSVTSIENHVNVFKDNQSSSGVRTVIKQEPLSPPAPEIVAEKVNHSGKECEVNISVSRPVQIPAPMEIPATLPVRLNNQNQGSDSEGIAAAYPGVIHNVIPSFQREDLEKAPEVSSSTGALFSDELQSTSVIGRCQQDLNSSDSTSVDLIKELLAINSAEEQLVQKAQEAERAIAHLTASLEGWKSRKNDIEKEQMELRTKRKLLLSTAALGSVSHDKHSGASVLSASSTSDKTSNRDITSGEEPESVATMSNASSTLSDKKSLPESDSSSSESLDGKHTGLNMSKRKKIRRTQDVSARSSMKLKLRSSKKINESVSDSSRFPSRRTKKRRICYSSLTEEENDSSCESRSPCRKKQHDVKVPQVILQPLDLQEDISSKTIIVNEDDDVIILDKSPCRAPELRVDLESSDEETAVVKKEEIDATSTESFVEPDFIVNIGTLQAHSSAVVDIKICDGYLYSCSLDWTAKRFSLADPLAAVVSYRGHAKTVTSICLSPDKEVYTTCHDGYLRCYNQETGDIISRFEMKSGIRCSCSGGRTIYLGLTSGEVFFFSYRLRRTVYELKCSTCAVCQLATVTQGAQRLLCVATNDGIVSLYDTGTGLLLRCLESHVQTPCCIQICDNSVYISTSEKAVVVHDLLSGKLEKMMNWAASATGLEIIDNFVLTSSYDGLVRCHDKNQDMVFHSIYYGAGKSTVMSMTAYKNWVFTGNRKGVIEVFKFDPSKQLPCEYGRCRQYFGRECDVLHHITIDHLPFVTQKAKICPWRMCSFSFTPRTTVEEKKEHIKKHHSSVHSCCNSCCEI